METQFINLNMTPSGVNPIFHISQYDVGRMLGFIVHSGGATVDLDTYTCTIEATRSDGTAITSAVSTTDNIGTFEVTPTMSNKADKYRCQLIIADENSKRIASLPFDMEVTKAAMDENSEAIEEDASLYQQYTKAVQGAIAEANADIQAEENARIAAVNAEATARQSADNTLQGNINSEASTRASADSNLQSQINQIVAPSGEAPSAAEVQNARIGADGVTYDTLGTAIRKQVSELKSEEYFEENKSKLAGNESIINDASSFNQNWSLASTTAIMQGIPITNAIKLKSVKYNVGESSLYQVHHIGLCTINENTATITHIKKNAGYLKGVVTFNVDFELDCDKEYYLFIICVSGIVQWTSDTKGTKYYTFTNPTSKEVGTVVSITPNGSSSVDIGEMDIVYKTDGNFVTIIPIKSGTIVVSKEHGDYSTLTEAVANANDSVDNPVTIILYPGVYEEHLTILDRYISIIGVNRDTCIIRNDSGKYNNDPIKISGGKWRLENISLISTHSKAGSWVPSWIFPDLPSYALHIDNGSANGFGVVNNCYLYCENLNTIGAGTHNGETIRIENCQIVRNTTDPNYISDGYKGAVACHSPNIYDNTETESHFNIYNCEIICNLDKALQLKHLSSNAKMKSIMVGNTLIANGSVTDVVNFSGSHTSKTDYIEIQSHGNSTPELNY